MSAVADFKPVPSKALNIGLWIAQILVAVVFCLSGFTKFFTPIPELSAMMPWAGDYSPTFVRFIGIVDMAGGLGLILPAATRIMPSLTTIAAACATLLQILAIGFHFSRGEAAVTPLNFVLLALLIFVLWGRWKKAPITARNSAAV